MLITLPARTWRWTAVWILQSSPVWIIKQWWSLMMIFWRWWWWWWWIWWKLIMMMLLLTTLLWTMARVSTQTLQPPYSNLIAWCRSILIVIVLLMMMMLMMIMDWTKEGEDSGLDNEWWIMAWTWTRRRPCLRSCAPPHCWGGSPPRILTIPKIFS